MIAFPFRPYIPLLCLWTTLIAFALLFDKKAEYDRARLQVELTQILIKAQTKLKERFELGDIEGVAQKQGASFYYFRSNPHYLNDFLKGNFPIPPYFLVSLKERGPLYKVFAKDIEGHLGEKVLLKNIHLAVVDLYVEGYSFWSVRVALPLQRDEVYLPKRRYGYKALTPPKDSLTFGDSVDWEWDNKGRHFFIDRFLVTEREVADWKMTLSEKDPLKSKIKVSPDPKKWPYPSTSLPLSLRRAYCAAQKKELLSAIIFDAATFYPLITTEDAEVLGSLLLRNALPWSPRMREEDLEQLPLAKRCYYLYSKECRSVRNFRGQEGRPVSWIGLSDLLGGVMESFENPLHPKENLKVSSYYLSYDSPWHLLGERAFWDGEGLERHHFVFDRPAPFEDDEGGIWQVGFRCMRESFRGEHEVH